MTVMRVLLRPEITAQDMAEAAEDLDWALAEHFDASDERPYEDLYVDDAQENRVSFIDDHLIDLRYVVVRDLVPEADVADAAAGVRESLPNYAPGEALAALRDAATAGERTRGVYIAALGGSTERSELLAALREAATNDAPEVRRAVILAAGYLGWRDDLRPLLTELARRDPDERVSAEAAAMADALDQPDVEEY